MEVGVYTHNVVGCLEFAGLENDGLKNAGLQIGRLENAGLENAGLEIGWLGHDGLEIGKMKNE